MGMGDACRVECLQLRQTIGHPCVGPHVPLALMATLTRASSLSPTRAQPLTYSISRRNPAGTANETML